MGRRHSRLVDIVEVADEAGRRSEILHYEVLQPPTFDGDDAVPATGGDEWFDRSGTRLVTTDGVRFRSPRDKYTLVEHGGFAP